MHPHRGSLPAALPNRSPRRPVLRNGTAKGLGPFTRLSGSPAMRRRRSKEEQTRPWPQLLGGRIPMASLIQTLAVAEYLNFRHAANALGVAQSSISARVRMLEEDLGVLLFERHTRGVRLTEAGRAFVEQISSGIDQINHAVKAAGIAAAGERGRLRIGIHGLIPGSFLDGLLTRFRLERPAIVMEIVEGSARETMAHLRARRIDVAFLVGTFDLPDCHSRPIWTEPLMVAMAEGHWLAERSCVTWDDLAGETFLVRHGGTGPQVHDHIVLRLAGRWPPPNVQRFLVERGTLLSMVAQGFGVTLLGAASQLSPTAGVALLPITDEPAPIVFSAIWSPFDQSQTLRNLLDLAGKMGRETGAAPL